MVNTNGIKEVGLSTGHIKTQLSVISAAGLNIKESPITSATITLVRHGKPEGAINPTVTATGFSLWVKNYDHSLVQKESLPPKDNVPNQQKMLIVSSTLKRAIHSAELYTGQNPEIKFKVLKEMEIPRYRLPFKMKAYNWLILNRFLWFVGIPGYGESYKEAKVRAQKAAHTINKLSTTSPHILIFGHSMINRYVAKELVKMGWNGRPKFTSYWGSTTLCSPHQLP